MTSKDIIRALQTLRSGSAWVIHGEDLSGLEWLDSAQSRPSDDEIVSAIASYVPPLSLQDQIATLQAQVAALLAAQQVKP